MKRKDIIELIPLLTLTFFGIYSIFQVLTTKYIFGYQQHIGLTLLGVSIILFFSNRRLYTYIFGITLLLGVFNVIAFTTSIVVFSLFGLPIQILPSFISFIFLIVYWDDLKPKLLLFVGKSEDHIELEKKAKIAQFKKRFQKLSDEEIEQKLNDNLVPEAIEALSLIIDKRKDKL